MARREASILNESMASFPQAPYDSATRGIQHHPKALHLGSFSMCLLSSVDNAAAPADNPATDKTLGFSGDVTEISKAAGLPRAQLGSKMSAGHGLNIIIIGGVFCCGGENQEGRNLKKKKTGPGDASARI